MDARVSVGPCWNSAERERERERSGERSVSDVPRARERRRVDGTRPAPRKHGDAGDGQGRQPRREQGDERRSHDDQQAGGVRVRELPAGQAQRDGDAGEPDHGRQSDPEQRVEENRERKRHGARMLLRSVQHTSPCRSAETIRLYGRAFRDRAITERDLREFRRSYGDVLGPTPAPTGGVALLASLSYSPFQLKLEGMFAKSFQLQGSSRSRAVPADGRAAAPLPRAVRGAPLRAARGLPDARLEDEAEREAARRCSTGVRDAGDLKTLTFRGADVGRAGPLDRLPLPARRRRRPRGPASRELLGRLLPSAVKSTLAFEPLLDELQPELVLFNERNYADQGPLMRPRARLRGLNVVQFVGGFEDDTLVLQALHGRDEGDPPALARRRVVGARACAPWGERRSASSSRTSRRATTGARSSLA